MTRTEGKPQLIYSATGCELGLLVNVGHYPKLEYERLVNRKQESTDVTSEIFASFCVIRGPNR
jgi:hypothetical protein